MFSKLLVGAAIAAAPALAVAIDESSFANVIERDVAIIGGGSSGSHAAVRLREDLGKSIVVIEKKSHLGGHVDTYYDPISNQTFDYGVQTYLNITGASHHFERFGVATTPYVPASKITHYLDFTTGKNLTGLFNPPSGADAGAAMAKYLSVAAQYEDYLLPGYWNFPKPKDIPEDLLLPFGQFVAKYGVEAAMPLLWISTGLGVGDIMEKSTIWVMQSFGAPMARLFTGQLGAFVPASKNNSELYVKIANKLGSDVIYSSTVTSSQRTNNGVTLVVTSNDGKTQTLIKAKRLLVAILPTPENLAPFDLDATEAEVHSHWDYSLEYDCLVTHPSLTQGYQLVNLPEAAAPNNYTVLPQTQLLSDITYAIGNLFRVVIVGDRHEKTDSAKKLVTNAFKNLIKSGALPPSTAEPQFIAPFSEHGPMHLRVSNHELKYGFIQELYALQGLRSTWYTGAGWGVHFSTHLWQYNEIVLPKLLAGL